MADMELSHAATILDRYVASGGADADEIPEAAVAFRRALAALPPGRPEVLGLTGKLLTCLRLIFAVTADVAVLDDAIESGRRALRETARQDEVPLEFWAGLAGIHNARFQHTGDAADLEVCRRYLQSALDSGAASTPRDRVALLSNLAFTLRTQAEATGDPEAITRAVALARQADEEAPAEIRLKTAYMLSSILGVRYQQVGDSGDLEQAVALAREVVRRTPDDHPERAGYLANLAALELATHERTGDPQALRDCVGHYDDLVAMVDEVRSIRPVVMANWSAVLDAVTNALEAGADHRPALALLDRMMPHLHAAAEEASGTAHWPWAMAGLGRASLARHAITGAAADLAGAVSASGDAAGALPVDHPDRATFLTLAAGARLERWRADRRRPDLEAAQDLLGVAAEQPLADAVVRVQAARLLGDTAMEHGGPSRALPAYRRATGLLPLVAWPGTSRGDQEHRLLAVAGLGIDAAAVALGTGQPGAATELSEAGRSVLWAGLLDRRRDLTAVAAAAPGLAGELSRVRREWDA